MIKTNKTGNIQIVQSKTNLVRSESNSPTHKDKSKKEQVEKVLEFNYLLNLLRQYFYDLTIPISEKDTQTFTAIVLGLIIDEKKKLIEEIKDKFEECISYDDNTGTSYFDNNNPVVIDGKVKLVDQGEAFYNFLESLEQKG